MAQHFDSDYQVRKAILAAIGGDATKHYHSVYDIDIAILEAVEGGGGGEGMTWEQIKNKLETSGVTSINFTNGSEGAILDYATLKELIEGGGGNASIKVVSELPEVGDPNTTYILTKEASTEVRPNVADHEYHELHYGDKFGLGVGITNHMIISNLGEYPINNYLRILVNLSGDVAMRYYLSPEDYQTKIVTVDALQEAFDELGISPEWQFSYENTIHDPALGTDVYIFRFTGDTNVAYWYSVYDNNPYAVIETKAKNSVYYWVNNSWLSPMSDEIDEIKAAIGDINTILENIGEIITVTEGETLTQELYDALRGDSTNKQVCMVPTRVSAFAAFGICSGALCYAVGQGKDFGATQLTYEFRATTSKIGSAITFDYIYDDLPIELVEGSTFTQDLYDQLQNNPTHRPILLKGTGMLPCIGIFAGGAVAGVTDLSTANGLLTTITYTISSGNVGAAISFTRSQVVDDTKVSLDNTWSSTKINSIVGDINTALETIIGG